MDNYSYYYKNKPTSDWVANGPAESGHNFIDQINAKQGDINAKRGEYGTQQGVVGSARTAYEDAYKNQQGYGDLYRSAKGEEGVDDARAQYQKSLAAVNATNSAMNNLPSSVNAGSNVVLNQNQRNAALGNQMMKYQNTLDYQTRQNAGDLSQYQTALSSAQNLAGQSMADQQARVSQTMTNYQAQMNQLNELYNQVIAEEQIMRSIYGDMYEDEYRHMRNEIEMWAKQVDAETARAQEAGANYRAALSKAASDYAADAGLRYFNAQQQALANQQRNANTGGVGQSYITSQGFYRDVDGKTGQLGHYVDYVSNPTNGRRVQRNTFVVPE